MRTRSRRTTKHRWRTSRKAMMRCSTAMAMATETETVTAWAEKAQTARSTRTERVRDLVNSAAMMTAEARIPKSVMRSWKTILTATEMVTVAAWAEANEKRNPAWAGARP